MATERVETSFTSVSWIPAEAMTGFMRLPMDVGLGHYDPPPPEHLDDLDGLVAAGRCRFANRLNVWADITDGHIVDSGSSGGGMVAKTEVDLKALTIRVAAIPFPEIRDAETDDTSVTYVQTAGGRTGAPFPRRAGSASRFRLKSPTAWTTLAVTVRQDGSVSAEPRGASSFPRHWFYDNDGRLVQKSATIDFDLWTAGDHNADTPWGQTDRLVLAADTESSLERYLSRSVMADRQRSTIRVVRPGGVLMTQGEEASSMELLIDGIVEIEVDGVVVAECGPGSLLGERAFLERGQRTSTVRAVTRVKVVGADPESFSPAKLAELRELHQRELDAD
ncbi:MAG: cyclic nucleotide-binding domain-containing protein [Actinomycetota bacterium]